MKKLVDFKSSISAELNQDKILQGKLILKILSSKRLLVDHVETIEDALSDLIFKGHHETNYISFINTSAILATSYVVLIHFKQKYLIPTLVIPLMYCHKQVSVWKREKLESKLSKFIASLDHYESAIKKNKSFLQESQVIKSNASILKRFDKDNMLPSNLISSIKCVIDALYSFVKLLESYSIADSLSLMYEPFEDLQDCDLMRMELKETDPVDLKLIKDFFNIFAYVQSQVLLRLSLITISSLDDCKVILRREFDQVTELIRTETANISKFLELINNVSQLQVTIQKQIDKEISLTIPKELREVRSGSIKFSTKILTTAIQCQNLEEMIVKFIGNFEHPNNKVVQEILDLMKAVENELSFSIDEHKRVAILFQKYLNMETVEAKTLQDNHETTEKRNENLMIVTADDVVPQADDFFFVDGTTTETVEDKATHAETIEEVNSKLAKKYFKPVLVQLKERIEVISEDMKEREKKVLKAKGIEMDDEPEVAKPLCASDEDDSGSEDERERHRKLKRNQEKFNANREFLEAKQPINIFAAGGFPFPRGPALDEDVLE